MLGFLKSGLSVTDFFGQRTYLYTWPLINDDLFFLLKVFSITYNASWFDTKHFKNLFRLTFFRHFANSYFSQISSRRSRSVSYFPSCTLVDGLVSKVFKKRLKFHYNFESDRFRLFSNHWSNSPLLSKTEKHWVELRNIAEKCEKPARLRDYWLANKSYAPM